MPSVFVLPAEPTVLYGNPEARLAITAASDGDVFADGKKLRSRIVVEHPVVIQGVGRVTVEETDDKATVKPSPQHDTVLPAAEVRLTYARLASFPRTKEGDAAAKRDREAAGVADHTAEQTKHEAELDNKKDDSK